MECVLPLICMIVSNCFIDEIIYFFVFCVSVIKIVIKYEEGVIDLQLYDTMENENDCILVVSLFLFSNFKAFRKYLFNLALTNTY